MGWGGLAGGCPRGGADDALALTPGQLFHVEVVALMNDTVGTMMTCSTRERPCEVALVVGEQQASRAPGWWVPGVGAAWVLTPIAPRRQGHQQLLHGRSTVRGDGGGDQRADVCQHRVGLLRGR